MRIGIDGGTWGNARGYGRFTRELVRAMTKLDRRNMYTLLLDRFTPTDDVPSELSILNVATQQSPARAASADGYRSPRDLWTFGRAIARAPIDCIFFPSVYTFVPVLRRMKVVVGVHDVIAERFPQYIFNRARAKLFWNLKTQLAVRQATRVLTVSEHARRGIQAHFHLPPEKIWVTSEAPAPRFRPIADGAAVQAAFARIGLAPKTRAIIFFGGLAPHKNIPMLIRVFADLIRDKRFAALKLLIVGDYAKAKDVYLSAYPALRAQVDATCPDAVIFTGFVDDETLAHLLNGVQACVLPSLDEGFGLPGVEAAACGAPLIATRESALPDLLGDAALYIDPTQPDELRRQLEKLLLDGALRQAMRERLIARARQLTWEDAAQRVIQLFDQL